MTAEHCLVLRLAGPLQSWGSASQYNRRETDSAPTKSGVIGLLAAAAGRRRTDPITDLLDLSLGVRVDQEGSLLRDYHTVSDFRGRPLLAAKVDAKGRQKPTSPAKYTGVTQRFYLQDAAFVAVVGGDANLLAGLADAVRNPTFPLALGRRSCVPGRPPLVPSPDGESLWSGSVHEVIHRVDWQASEARRDRLRRRKALGSTVTLAATVDSGCVPVGSADREDLRTDVPQSFDQLHRGFSVRSVQHLWVELSTGEPEPENAVTHDPFELLEWGP